MIYGHLLPNHLTVTYNDRRYHRMSRKLSRSPLDLMLSSQLIHAELQPLVTRNIESVLFEVPHRLFDAEEDKDGAWRSWREVSLCPRLVPDYLAKQLRHIELSIECQRWMCRRCLEGQIVAWRSRSPMLRKVLITVAVERVEAWGSGADARDEVMLLLEALEDRRPANGEGHGDDWTKGTDQWGTARDNKSRSAWAEPVWERWGRFDQVGVDCGVRVLVEFAVLGPVKMRCDGQRDKCGGACFEKNFVVRSQARCAKKIA